MNKSLIAALAFLTSVGCASAQWQVPNNTVPIGRGSGVVGFKSAAGGTGTGVRCLIDTAPPTFGTCPTSPSGGLTIGSTTISGGTTSTPLLNVGGLLANGTRSGNTTSFATTTGTLTSGNCVKFDASGNIIDSGGPCAGGSLTVASTTISGGTTSTPLLNVGGVLANGTRSGNTTSFATTTGTLTSQNCVKFDASGNLADAGAVCGSGSTFIYDTVAAATAATISSANTMIFLRGNNAVGDAGAGWWVRNASVPGHTMYFQSADGAYWVPSTQVAFVNMEQLGGRCGGTGFDNTAALNKYNSWIQVAGQLKLNFQGCPYYFNTQPSSFSGVAPYLSGTGRNGTILMKNFNGSGGVGFITMTGAGGSVIENMSIEANTGVTTGDGVRYNATSSNGSDGAVLSNIVIASFGSNGFDSMVAIDGHLRTTGAIGVRDQKWVNVTLFGSATAAVNALSVEAWSWHGGGIYPAGGTSAASIIISGLTAPMASSSVYVSLEAGTQIDMDFCTRCIFRAPSWSANIVNSANSNFCGVGGAVTGTKGVLWTNSNYLAF